MAQPLTYFAVNVGAPYGPKARELERCLATEIPSGWGEVVVAGLLTKLWEIAAMRGEDDGVVPAWPARRLAAALGWGGDPEVLLEALREVGWIDESSEGDRRCHDWADHQPGIRDRIRKRGGKLRPADGGSGENAQVGREVGREEEESAEQASAPPSATAPPAPLTLELGEAPKDDPIVARLRCSGGGRSEVPIRESDVARWQPAYPAVDVQVELLQMAAWLEANPRKRKTPGGMERFVISWLKREQDKGRPPASSTPRGGATKDFEWVDPGADDGPSRPERPRVVGGDL